MPLAASYFQKLFLFTILTVNLSKVFAHKSFLDSLTVASIEIFTTSYGADSSFIIPFSRAGNLIVLQGKADTVRGNFILDTGCPQLVLNLTYFRNYKAVEENSDGNGITGSGFTVVKSQVDSFSFGGAYFYHVPADITNLGNIENTKGIKILGLIGMEFLKPFEMIVDYEKSLIFLHRVNRKGPAYYNETLSDTSAYGIVPITISDNRIMVQTTLAGKKIKLIIDSGAESNLLDSRLPDKVFKEVSITGRTFLSGAGRAKIEVLQGDLKSLTLGNQSIKNLPVIISNLERTCFSYAGCVDGILGFDFLSLRKIGFNFVTNKMYIWK
jgi:hypothetical protein